MAIGLVLTVGALVALVAQMPGGALVDAVRSIKLIAGVAVAGICTSALGLALWGRLDCKSDTLPVPQAPGDIKSQRRRPGPQTLSLHCVLAQVAWWHAVKQVWQVAAQVLQVFPWLFL